MRALSAVVVGAQHPNAKGPTRRFAISLCRPGEKVELKREPTNPKDPHAVAVFNAIGIQMGYLSAERAPWIGGLMDKGRRVDAIFQSSTDYGAVVRIAFDGATLELPAPNDIPVVDPEFFADPDYPDEF
ncbi:HIRAN domain-containing protein [Sphingomonas sp. RB3P16]|uniref:HIRAN domain-containing protein n=1 Tax=Parasphingomonas frigoris TaxID=3096163 RepID=UPI002FCB6634